MTNFRYDSQLTHAPSTVFQWYQRPGAFTRLVPEFMGFPVSEPNKGLDKGSRSRLRLSPPWIPTSSGLNWTAEHTFLDVVGREFVDEQLYGPFRRWRHHHEIIPHGSGLTLIRDDIEYELPFRADRLGWAAQAIENQLDATFRFRQRRTQQDLDFHASYPEDGMTQTILITGSTGLIGTQLSAFLRSGGHRVVQLKSSEGPSRQHGRDNWTWNPSAGLLDPDAFAGVDVIVHLAGEPIGRRFTRSHRRKVMDSRVDSTRTLYRALTDFRIKFPSQPGPRALISASASGYYGHDTGDTPLNEDAPAGSDFLAQVCRRWEAETQRFLTVPPAGGAPLRIASVRTGLVLSATGGMLALQLPLYYAGLGGAMAGGNRWQSWISLDDLVMIYARVALDHDIEGPINAASPQPVLQREFAQILGQLLGRPTVLPTPSWGPKILLGAQGAQELALSNIRLRPRTLQRAGYEFAHETLDDCLADSLGLTRPLTDPLSDSKYEGDSA